MPDAAPHRLEPIRRDRTGVFRGHRRRRRVVRARRRSGHRVRRAGTGPRRAARAGAARRRRSGAGGRARARAPRADDGRGGAGVPWTDPGLGGRATGHARGRRGHEDGGFRERGLSGTVREGWPAPRTRPPRVTRRARQRRSCGPRPRWPVSIATTTASGRPARSCRWPPAGSVPCAGAPGRTLSGSAPPDVIGDISHWPRAVREGWRGAVGVWRRDEHRRP